MSPSPAVLVRALNWLEAQSDLLDGKKIRREAWPDPSVVVFVTDGYLKIRQPSGKLDALIVSEADMLATDWVTVREN